MPKQMKPNDPRWDGKVYAARKPGVYPQAYLIWNRRLRNIVIQASLNDAGAPHHYGSIYLDRRTARLLHRRLGELLGNFK